MAEGFHDFASAEVLTAANTDDYLMRQTIMRFADASTRDSALSGVLVEGLRAYTKDTNRDWIYTGSAWRLMGGMNPPRCKAVQAAGMNITTATVTAVGFTAEDHDSDSLHNNATNNSRILLNQIGRWSVWYVARFDANTAGAREAYMCVNTAGVGTGATRYGWAGASPHSPTGAVFPYLHGYDEIEATATTDYVELFLYQSSGGTLLAGGIGVSYDLFLAVRYIGPLF
jgi:hypothetical protein